MTAHTSATNSCRLATSVAARTRPHPEQSGIVELRDARDAFAARAHLADAAERTLDIQYYIWRNDMSGTLLLEALRRAADRGVRVRLLLDDNNTSGLDVLLAALDAHPNIEIKLFNPFKLRRLRTLNFLFEFSRLNRRMHNKSFTADNEVTIVGGRNIGDEYFGAHDEIAFVDLDLMAIGPVVRAVVADFERYWNSESAHTATRYLRAPPQSSVDELVRAAERVTGSPAATAYTRALERSSFVRDLIAGTLQYEWAVTHVLSDDPAKALGRARPRGLLMQRLSQVLRDPAAELLLISPYFVPTREGVQAFAELVRSGVKVTVLTNALEATDVAVVHAGYAKHRKHLLKVGVVLYELRRMSDTYSGRDRKLTGSSGSSLHAKTFSIDRRRLFVGSFNFDPRSARLNTEMGFLVDSPVLAERIADAFQDDIPVRSYRVKLSKHGLLRWVEMKDGLEVVHRHEPAAPAWRRAYLYVLSKLPIEWLL
ncbi:MAG TPA: phospholipase D family protein [Steroidobacteraceae bacterium]|nr:phospholipase D family protein [Steroidobacteraceae bacterium]